MMFWMNTAEKDGEIKRFCGIGEYAYQLTLKKVEEKGAKPYSQGRRSYNENHGIHSRYL
jgi:hypothetical protein